MRRVRYADAVAQSCDLLWLLMFDLQESLVTKTMLQDGQLEFRLYCVISTHQPPFSYFQGLSWSQERHQRDYLFDREEHVSSKDILTER